MYFILFFHLLSTEKLILCSLGLYWAMQHVFANIIILKILLKWKHWILPSFHKKIEAMVSIYFTILGMQIQHFLFNNCYFGKISIHQIPSILQDPSFYHTKIEKQFQRNLGFILYTSFLLTLPFGYCGYFIVS